MKETDFKKQQKEFECWENSAEGIYYNLTICGNTDNEESSLITKTLLRIPKRYREKIIEKVVFYCISSGIYGLAERLDVGFTDLLRHRIISYKGKNSKDMKKFNSYKVSSFEGYKIPLIILNFDGMKNKSKSAKMDIIAHEIAHVILGDIGVGSNPKAERNADNLIEKWGFKKTYTEKFYKILEKLKK